MSATVIYRKAFLYEVAMRMLYGPNYSARYEALADLIPKESSVVDLCCGPAVLFERYLRYKSIRYTGLDSSEPFIRRLRERGGHGMVLNLQKATYLPVADYVVMQASLYHFLPDPTAIFERMLCAAGQRVIVAEPIRNITSSKNALIAMVGRRLTDPGNGKSGARFNEQALDRFFLPYASAIERTFLIPGGREKVYIFDVSRSSRSHPNTAATQRRWNSGRYPS